MTEFAIAVKEWLTPADDPPELAATSGLLEIRAGRVVLTRNEDIWSRTVRDAVLVSVYPLAHWLAWNWWRLSFEPLPSSMPPIAWRLAHELGAADHGYVWPRVLFASDGETVQVYAEPLATPGQSVQYLSGLEVPVSVPLAHFQTVLDSFLDEVVERLAATGLRHTALAGLWEQLRSERSDPTLTECRRFEALLGIDREDCPEEILAELLRWRNRIGPSAIEELSTAIGLKRDPVTEIASLEYAQGVNLAPQVKPETVDRRSAPWVQGVEAARHLRAHLGIQEKPITDAELRALLGIGDHAKIDDVTDKRRPATVVRRIQNETVLLPRKHHPTARRFELARVLGEWLADDPNDPSWRISTDAFTARQKRQRAFAAEFLCPIDALIAYLDGDFSDDAILDAASHFAVSEQTVCSLLANNGYLPRLDSPMPYRLAA
jgi:Zn-dependent peptidase ImmA (M78 family)